MLRIPSALALLFALSRVPFGAGEHVGKVAFNNRCPNCHASSACRPDARKAASAMRAISPGPRWAGSDARERARLVGFLKSAAER